MYLARQKDGSYVIRESVQRSEGLRSRDVHVLARDPVTYIKYPGSNVFYIDPELTQAVERRAKGFDAAEFERLFFPFVDPLIRRVVDRFESMRHRSKRHSRAEMARAQAGVHPFDKRRLHYLRYGHVDQPGKFSRPFGCFNQAVGRSRDEIEWSIKAAERVIPARDRKTYVYVCFDLQRFFPNNPMRLMPAALDREKLDEAFETALCRLDEDRSYLTEGYRASRLSDYLVKYLVMYYDSSFGGLSPEQEFIADFMRRHRVYRPPEKRMPFKKACDALGITQDELKNLDKMALTRIYRRLVKEVHPDRGGDAQRFIEVSEAFASLIEIMK